MPASGRSSKWMFQALGICSPYIAVLLGVFLFRNGFGAVLFYHLVLLAAILKMNTSKELGLLFKGFRPIIGPLICLGGLLPGVVIPFLWPIAKRNGIDLSEILAILNLEGRGFVFFAIYACLVNPFLEESFWRGCFKSETLWPNAIDVLFAGYHGLVIFPILKIHFVFLVFLAMICVGWLFRTLYRITGGLLIPLITHIIADIAILYAIWKIM